MTPLRLFLIRHGQTDSNAGGVLQGHLPTSLNTLGRAQAERLAERLRQLRPPVDVLVTSDLQRALETAEPIARALGLPARVDAAWRERGFGTLEGQTLGELAIWRAASGGLDPPGGEGTEAFYARIEAALGALAAEPGGDRVAVVTHGGAIRAVLHLLASGRVPRAAGEPPPEVVPIINGSILHMALDGTTKTSAWRVLRVNDAAHLAEATTDLDAG